MGEKTWKFALVDKRLAKKFDAEWGVRCVISPASFSKLGQLEWFRKLAYCDFKRLPDDEKALLYAEVQGWLRGVGPIDSISFPPKVTVEDLDKMEKWQTWFFGYFEMIFASLEGRGGVNALAPRHVPLDTYRAEILGIKGCLNLLPSPLAVILHASPYLMIADKSGIQKRSEFRTLVAPSEGHEFSYLFFQFLKVLNGLPLTAAWRCEECDHWYFNLSKRAKRFCSNRCAAAKGMREYRRNLKASDPKKYGAELAKNRKRARKSRVNKLALKYKIYKRIKESEEA